MRYGENILTCFSSVISKKVPLVKLVKQRKRRNLYVLLRIFRKMHVSLEKMIEMCVDIE